MLGFSSKFTYRLGGSSRLLARLLATGSKLSSALDGIDDIREEESSRSSSAEVVMLRRCSGQ